MGNKDKSIKVKLTSERKAEWKRVAGEYNKSLSDFIRTCVAKERARDGNNLFETNSQSASNDASTEVLDRLDKIESQLGTGDQSIHHRLAAIESQLTDDPAARDLASAVYGALAAQEDFVPDDPTHPDPGFDRELYEREGGLSGEPSDIARFLGEQESDVRRALDNLRADMHNVHEDEGRYYRS